LFWASGILLVVIGLLSFVVAYGARVLYSGGYPADPAAYLELVSQHLHLAANTWTLWVVMDFLSLPPIVALTLILLRHNRSLAILGGLVVISYAIYDVSVTELNSLILVSLAREYAHATTNAARASLIAAASYGYYALPLQTFLSFAIGPIGYILWCVPMARSFFGRWMAIFGIFVSVVGLLGSAAPLVPSSFLLGLAQFLCVRLIAIWVLILGVQLCLHARRMPPTPSSPCGSR
jgi:hypothetical protein